MVGDGYAEGKWLHQKVWGQDGVKIPPVDGSERWDKLLGLGENYFFTRGQSGWFRKTQVFIIF